MNYITQNGMKETSIYIPEEIQRRIFNYEHQLRMKDVLHELCEYNMWTCDECDREYHIKDGEEFRIKNMMFTVCGVRCKRSVEHDHEKYMNARYRFQSNQN